MLIVYNLVAQGYVSENTVSISYLTSNRDSMLWVRPENVAKGKIWRRFKGRERKGQPVYNYQIRDMPEKDRELCVNLMTKTFLEDEPLCQVLEIPSDQESIVTIIENWQSYIDQGVSLACYTEDQDGRPGELVAFNICLVRSKGDPDEDIDKVKGESWRKLLRTLTAVEECCDVFEHYQVDKFFTSSGLTVATAHRGQNIGAEMFKAREPLCRALGVDAVATVFTAVTSQVLAAKCGYELLAELPYKKMLEQDIDLVACDTPCGKLMGTKYI